MACYTNHVNNFRRGDDPNVTEVVVRDPDELVVACLPLMTMAARLKNLLNAGPTRAKFTVVQAMPTRTGPFNYYPFQLFDHRDQLLCRVSSQHEADTILYHLNVGNKTRESK